MTTSIPVLIYFSSLKKLVKMRELFEGTAKIAILNFSKNPLFMRHSADKCSQYITGFRVSPVMTTSIPVHATDLSIISTKSVNVKRFCKKFLFFAIILNIFLLQIVSVSAFYTDFVKYFKIISCGFFIFFIARCIYNSVSVVHHNRTRPIFYRIS